MSLSPELIFSITEKALHLVSLGIRVDDLRQIIQDKRETGASVMDVSAMLDEMLDRAIAETQAKIDAALSARGK